MIIQKHKVIVAVYLKGDRLDPAAVSKLLGLAPSQTQYKGQKWLSSTSREVVAKTGMWSLRMERDIDTIDLVGMTNEFMDKIQGKVAAFKDLPGLEEAYLDVFIATDTDDEGGGTCTFELNEQNLAALSSLQLPIRFTLTVVKP